MRTYLKSPQKEKHQGHRLAVRTDMESTSSAGIPQHMFLSGVRFDHSEMESSKRCR